MSNEIMFEIKVSNPIHNNKVELHVTSDYDTALNVLKTCVPLYLHGCANIESKVYIENILYGKCTGVGINRAIKDIKEFHRLMLICIDGKKEKLKPKIEVGKFYDLDGKKIFIEYRLPVPILNMTLCPTPNYKAFTSDGSRVYITDIEEERLKPWDFKGEKPTVCPAVGKWYKNRMGEIVRCEKNSKEHMYWVDGFHFRVNDDTFNYFGMISYQGNTSCGRDLIEEVPQPKKELVLEDGCWYQDGNGNIVQVFDSKDGSKYPFYYYPSSSLFRFFFDKNGKVFRHGFICEDFSKFDLIKKADGSNKKLTLEVDCFYRARCGRKIYIYKGAHDDFFGAITHYVTSCWDKYGKNCNDFLAHEFDIVAKWED